MKKRRTNSELINKPIKRDQKLYSYVFKTADDIASKICEVIHRSEVDQGGIILVVGPQSSGKSLVGMNLIECFYKNGRSIVASQPKVDRPDVPDNKLFSRAGYEMAAVSFQTKRDIEKLFHDNDIVVIDEVQFTPPALQSYLLKELRLFRDRGGWAVILGLLFTSLGTEFLISLVLKEESKLTFELKSTCQMCGRRNAKYNQRLVNGRPAPASAPDLMPPSSQVVYEPRCKDCYVVVGD